MIETDGERELRKSTLAIRHDDDDDDICMSVFMCVFFFIYKYAV